MPKWLIFENSLFGWLSVSGPPGPLGNLSMAPKIESREDFDLFMSELMAAGDRVWPKVDDASS